jgi:peptide/nickel transport system permease protein
MVGDDPDLEGRGDKSRASRRDSGEVTLGVLRLAVARAAQAALVITLVATLAFALIHLAPGDPFSVTLDDPAVGPETAAQQRALWGFDRPLPEQYVKWISNLAHGELGYSIMRLRNVSQVLRETVPNTLLLMGTALTFGLIGGVALGTWQAARVGTRAERSVSGLTMLALSVPEFLLALAALTILSLRLRWFPVGRMIEPAMHETYSALGRAGDVLWHLALPAALLAALLAAAIARYHRTAMLVVLPDDFVRTARAKGARELVVLVRHALRNALGPVITIAGLVLPALFGGAVFVEKIFNWPGMGLAMIEAVGRRDYPLVLAGVVLGSAMVAVGSAIADVLALLVDPRLREAT